MSCGASGAAHERLRHMTTSANDPHASLASATNVRTAREAYEVARAGAIESLLRNETLDPAAFQRQLSLYPEAIRASLGRGLVYEHALRGIAADVELITRLGDELIRAREAQLSPKAATAEDGLRAVEITLLDACSLGGQQDQIADAPWLHSDGDWARLRHAATHLMTHAPETALTPLKRIVAVLDAHDRAAVTPKELRGVLREAGEAVRQAMADQRRERLALSDGAS